MVKKGKNFSGKVTPLFNFMLVQQTKDEGEASERPSDSQPIPFPPRPSEDQPQTQTDPSPRPSPSIAVPDSNPEGFGGNHKGQSSNDASLLGNEDGSGQEAIERSQTTYHTSQSLDEHKIGKEDFSEEKGVHKEYVSKQGRKFVKSFKGEPSVHKDPAFDDLDDIMDDAIDYIESEDAQDEGRTSSMVLEEKESADKEVSTEAPEGTDKKNEGTNKKNKGTDKQDGGTDSTEVSTDRQGKGTADQNEGKSTTQTAPTPTSTPTPTIFGDDETIAQIDPKDKGKKRTEEEDESDTESEEIIEAKKKFKQLANDEEVAKKVQEEWEAEEEKKRLAEEEATKVALTNEYDFIQARINADKILAEELQKEEREKFTIEQRAKFLHDTIAAQRKFLAQQRSEAIRNKPPKRNQLRNQMMTYLKHVGGKKHSELKTKTFEKIQDESQIKELNKDPEKKILKKRVVNETPREEDTSKVPAEQEVTEQGTKKRKSGHVKMIARKRPRPQPDDDSDDEHIKCLRIVTSEGTIDSEIMETKSFIARLHKVSSPDVNYLVVYKVNGHFRAFNYLMEVLYILDRQDLFHLYDLVMKQYSEITPEDIEWRLYEACGFCILELKDGTVINMLVERRYSLSKELLQQMIELGLKVEEESTASLQLGSQLTLLYSKELASPGSNSSWLSIHLVVYNEELAIPKQMATGNFLEDKV
ncbi:hypothetical protein Tco_0984501 [Tanacetum coccineum]